MKRLILRSLQGIFLGAFVAVIITNSLIFFGGIEELSGRWFLENSLGSVFSGWVIAVSLMIFEIKKISLLLKTLLHIPILLSLNIYFNYLGWIPINSTLYSFLMFVALYGLIWVGIYLYYKITARRMNDALKKL